jgi:protein tyrosine/serine phosphatase
MSIRSAAILVAVAVGACAGQSPRLLHPTDPATDFYTVSPGIYRGGRLTEAGVLTLKKLGVKTIINLEDDSEEIAQETQWAKAASITQLRESLSGYWAPDDKQVDRILKELADPAARPIYIHCKKGMDRTGIIVALHRVYNEGWAASKAEAERDALGFNHWLPNLDRYYLWKAARYKLKHEIAAR